MTDTFENVTDIDWDKITLEEMIVAIGSTLFAGYDLSDYKTIHLNRLRELVQAELIIRESELPQLRYNSRAVH